MIRINLITLILFAIIAISCTKKEPQDPETAFKSFSEAENIEMKMAIFDEFKETNPNDEYLDRMFTGIIGEMIYKKELLKVADYVNENENLVTANIYNAIAWNTLESKENLDLGTKLAVKGVELAREELKSFKDSKPESLSEEEWHIAKKQTLAFVLDTYGSLEKELGNNENVKPAFEEAVELTNSEFAELNENYVTSLIENQEFEKAKEMLEKYVSLGKYSPTMKTKLKEIFIQLGSNEKDFPEYMAKFEEMAKAKMIEKLKNEIKNEIAPDFELTDLDGNNVKLSDYKGKTIILDFWATWCGPCLQSFPAMKKAMESFSNNKNVKFLFANTWERVENKKQNASDFIRNNNYPFHVLMDYENEVVKKFNVRGIPTKFIIDKNQNIRFESVGFSGNEEDLIQELQIMVSMIE